MIVVVLRTKTLRFIYTPERARVTQSRLQWEEIYISILPSLPSTPRRVPSGHGTKSSILYLHSPTVRPKVIVRLSRYPLIQASLNDDAHVMSHILIACDVYLLCILFCLVRR